MYVELHARSAFSFLQAAALPEELAQSCAALEMPAMALLDAEGVYGAPRFHLAAEKLGIKAHIGAELPLQMEAANPARTARLPVLVKSRSGYQNLCRLITRMKMRVAKHAPASVSSDRVVAP